MELTENWHHLTPGNVRAGDWLYGIDGCVIRGGMMEVREIRYRPAQQVRVFTGKGTWVMRDQPERWEFIPVIRTRSSRFAFTDDVIVVSRIEHSAEHHEKGEPNA